MVDPKWKADSGNEKYALVVQILDKDGREGFSQCDPVDLVCCLNTNPTFLTAAQWAEVLAALPPETQDGITDALVVAGTTWGVARKPATAGELRDRIRELEAERDTLRAEVAKWRGTHNGQEQDPNGVRALDAQPEGKAAEPLTREPSRYVPFPSDGLSEADVERIVRRVMREACERATLRYWEDDSEALELQSLAAALAAQEPTE